MEIEDVTLEMIEEMFWQGAEKGWASGKHGTPFSNMPGYKGFWSHWGDLSYVDAYCSGPKKRSWGFTTIWFNGRDTSTPVWNMSYEGWYEEKAIPFLKEALKAAIKEKVFLGGRGQKMFTSKNYPNFYYSNIQEPGDFHSFAGRESIFSLGDIHLQNDSLGCHEYRGGLL